MAEGGGGGEKKIKKRVPPSVREESIQSHSQNELDTAVVDTLCFLCGFLQYGHIETSTRQHLYL